ncbi:hypothetical protein DINM_022110 [Dirofilaria immitis]|nr:hypothetical protein [Dirofilaria immitis]
MINETASLTTSSITTWMPPTQGAHIFGTVFIGCGIVAIIFNATVMITLCRLRRNITSHVFYLLIFNFAIIDLLKSTCSVIWALKMLPAGVSTSMYFMKADQFALMILRFANLATILNLLILTLNEYIYIIYPFYYRRFVTNSQMGISLTAMYYIRWSFQTLMCLNTLLQPLCYFRMREFRSAFKSVIFRLKRSESIVAESTYLSITESRRRTTLGNSDRNNINRKIHTV